MSADKTKPFLTLNVLTYLTDMWKRENSTERLGQYIMNRTSFNQDEYDGVIIFYETDWEKVFSALTTYCSDTHN